MLGIDIKIKKTLITSCDAIPPMKAATAWSSEAPNLHISLIRSSVKVAPLQPKSLSRPTAAVFSRDISSSISLWDTNHSVHKQCSVLLQQNSFLMKGSFRQKKKKDAGRVIRCLPFKLPRKTVIISSKPVNSSKQDIKPHCNTATYVNRKSQIVSKTKFSQLIQKTVHLFS